MIEALEKAVRDAQALPEQQQREIAELVEQKVADMRWDALFAQPASGKLLREMAAEAIEEDEAGQTRASDETW